MDSPPPRKSGRLALPKCPLPSPVKPNPCSALPHPVEMLETTGHLWGKLRQNPGKKYIFLKNHHFQEIFFSLTC